MFLAAGATAAILASCACDNEEFCADCTGTVFGDIDTCFTSEANRDGFITATELVGGTCDAHDECLDD